MVDLFGEDSDDNQEMEEFDEGEERLADGGPSPFAPRPQ